MILSIHIPKTAGTTFRAVLDATFGRRLAFDYNRSTDSHPALRRLRQSLPEADWPAAFIRYCEANGIDVLHGHFHLSRYLATAPDAEVICWLRDPVARLVSHYRDNKLVKRENNETAMRVWRGELDLLDFARLPENIDLMSAHIRPLTLEQLRFVGLVEDFAGSLKRFRRTFRLPRLRKVALHNVTGGEAPDLDEPTKAELRMLNPADVALYEQALALFPPTRRWTGLLGRRSQ